MWCTPRKITWCTPRNLHHVRRKCLYIITSIAYYCIAKVRIDAYKYTTQIRRPKAQKVENIGAWLGILKAITFIAVVLNVSLIISRQKTVKSDYHVLLTYFCDPGCHMCDDK